MLLVLETFIVAPFVGGFFSLFFLQFGTAVFAILGFEVVTLAVAPRTSALLQLFVLADHRGRYDACRYGNDGVADEHDDGREKTSYWSNRGYVAIAYCRHGDNGPIDAVGDVVEAGAVFRSLDHVHYRAHRSDQYQYEKEEYHNLRGTDPQRPQQQVALVDEGKELEDAEDTDEAESPDDQQIVRPVQEETQVDRQRGQQIDDAEEAEDILPWLLQAVDTRQVFDGEEYGQQILQHPQHEVSRVGEDVHAFEYHQQYTEQNAAYQDNVEHLALRRVRLEYDGVDFLLQFVVVQEVLPTLV